MILSYPGPERDYTVLVRCFTFNQSKYIEETLNGFVMQQTIFPFVCLVVDDASTDGEPEVIKSWMERECDMTKAKRIDIPTSAIVIVPHKTNENCTMAFYLLKENLFWQPEKKMRHVLPWREHCRYEAICEGDDYWIEPLKLQKQVDLLEAHPDVTMVYTAFNVVDAKSVPLKIDFYEKCMNKSHSGWIFEKLLQRNFILTLTTIFPKRIIYEYNADIDYKLFLYAARKGKTIYLDDRTSNYRINPTSIQHTNKQLVSDSYEKALYLEIKEYVKYKNNTTHPVLLNNFRLKCLVARIIVSKIRRYKRLRKKYLLLLLVRPWYLLWTTIAIIRNIKIES